MTAVSTALTSTTRAQEPTGFLNRAIEVEGISYRYQVYVPAGYPPESSRPPSAWVGHPPSRGALATVGVHADPEEVWLPPILIVMLLLGALLVSAQGSAPAPFIYTIF